MFIDRIIIALDFYSYGVIMLHFDTQWNFWEISHKEMQCQFDSKAVELMHSMYFESWVTFIQALQPT